MENNKESNPKHLKEEKEIKILLLLFLIPLIVLRYLGIIDSKALMNSVYIILLAFGGVRVFDFIRKENGIEKSKAWILRLSRILLENHTMRKFIKFINPNIDFSNEITDNKILSVVIFPLFYLLAIIVIMIGYMNRILF